MKTPLQFLSIGVRLFAITGLLLDPAMARDNGSTSVFATQTLMPRAAEIPFGSMGGAFLKQRRRESTLVTPIAAGVSLGLLVSLITYLDHSAGSTALAAAPLVLPELSPIPEDLRELAEQAEQVLGYTPRSRKYLRERLMLFRDLLPYRNGVAPESQMVLAERYGVTQRVVADLMSRLNITPATRAEKGRKNNARRGNPKALASFLRLRPTSLFHQETLADMFGVSIKTVSTFQRRLGVTPLWKKRPKSAA